MNEIIDLEERQNIRDTNPMLRYKDADGRTWFKFTCSYEFEGSAWVLDFWALNKDDAEARCQAIKATLQVDGMVCEEIPA